MYHTDSPGSAGDARPTPAQRRRAGVPCFHHRGRGRAPTCAARHETPGVSHGGASGRARAPEPAPRRACAARDVLESRGARRRRSRVGPDSPRACGRDVAYHRGGGERSPTSCDAARSTTASTSRGSRSRRTTCRCCGGGSHGDRWRAAPVRHLLLGGTRLAPALLADLVAALAAPGGAATGTLRTLGSRRTARSATARARAPLLAAGLDALDRAAHRARRAGRRRARRGARPRAGRAASRCSRSTATRSAATPRRGAAGALQARAACSPSCTSRRTASARAARPRSPPRCCSAPAARRSIHARARSATRRARPAATRRRGRARGRRRRRRRHVLAQGAHGGPDRAPRPRGRRARRRGRGRDRAAAREEPGARGAQARGDAAVRARRIRPRQLQPRGRAGARAARARRRALRSARCARSTSRRTASPTAPRSCSRARCASAGTRRSARSRRAQRGRPRGARASPSAASVRATRRSRPSTSAQLPLCARGGTTVAAALRDADTVYPSEDDERERAGAPGAQRRRAPRARGAVGLAPTSRATEGADGVSAIASALLVARPQADARGGALRLEQLDVSRNNIGARGRARARRGVAPRPRGVWSPPRGRRGRRRGRRGRGRRGRRRGRRGRRAAARGRRRRGRVGGRVRGGRAAARARAPRRSRRCRCAISRATSRRRVGAATTELGARARAQLRADDALLLAGVLRHNTSVVSVDLDGNALGDEGVAPLLEALRRNPTLTSALGVLRRARARAELGERGDQPHARQAGAAAAHRRGPRAHPEARVQAAARARRVRRGAARRDEPRSTA